jgi:hypothetical protein
MWYWPLAVSFEHDAFCGRFIEKLVCDPPEWSSGLGVWGLTMVAFPALVPAAPAIEAVEAPNNDAAAVAMIARPAYTALRRGLNFT